MKGNLVVVITTVAIAAWFVFPAASAQAQITNSQTTCYQDAFGQLQCSSGSSVSGGQDTTCYPDGLGQIKCDTRTYTSPSARSTDSTRSTGVDFGAFSRGAAQAEADFHRDQQMQQNAVMQDLQVQQMLRNSQLQQYENMANTYLSTVPALRQKTLANGMSECGFWLALGRRIGSDQNFINWPKELQTIIHGKLGEMVFQATDGKGCIKNTKKNKQKKTVK